jgi:hypothetical protein
VLIPQVRPAHKYPNSPGETIHLPGEIMQYVLVPTRATRLEVPSHSQPLINTKYLIQVTTNEPIGLIILITSWLTSNISTFPSRSNEHHYCWQQAETSDFSGCMGRKAGRKGKSQLLLWWYCWQQAEKSDFSG